VAEEISEEAAHKLYDTYSEHIGLEFIAVVLEWKLYGVIVAVVADLSQTKHDQGQYKSELCKSIFQLRLIFL